MSDFSKPSMVDIMKAAAGHPRNQTEITSTPFFSNAPELRRPDIEYTQKEATRTVAITLTPDAVACLERAAYEHLAKDGAFLSRGDILSGWIIDLMKNTLKYEDEYLVAIKENKGFLKRRSYRLPESVITMMNAFIAQSKEHFLPYDSKSSIAEAAIRSHMFGTYQ